MESRCSMGSVVRKRLSDITNTQQRPKSPGQDEKPRHVSSTAKDFVDRLHKENMALMRVLADRNKIIELSGLEMQKLRINLQKMQQQNWHLAQTNSRMLVEINLGKDRRKALQHELGCKEALIKAKKLEEGTAKCEEAAAEPIQGNGDNKLSTLNRSSDELLAVVGHPSVIQQVAAKEKVHNKRPCLRRKSARFKSEQSEPTEDLFEIEDAKFPVCSQLDDPTQEDGPFLLDSSARKEEQDENSASRYINQELRRSSIGRPSRKAVEKVQSYKEVPLNTKMRRSK
ncbi:hypothetical protein HHK36_018147 [Tetracentron sinense]|uniref:Shugoshin C-terminal domain-containing protein n=1 Tax=Tetracentron sinense TaxID=13715 RepID=A0A835DAJ7_TETSI|nr:hypothetical protein HHK36_018147 [Tetracentron sinense]